MSRPPIAIVWMRRDLRLHDNTALYHALQSGIQVLPLFIFDTAILDKLEDKQDRRVEFIHHSLTQIQEQLQAIGSTLLVCHGKPSEVWMRIISEFDIKAVYTNHDYEPYAQERDGAIATLLHEKGIAFHSYKDQCIFEKQEIMTQGGKPYTVFTPYSKAWKAALRPQDYGVRDTRPLFSYFLQTESTLLPSLQSLGFEPSGAVFPAQVVRRDILHSYHETRNYPAVEGTSMLSTHLRFGTVSIRELVQQALDLNETFLNELIWREFYMMILANFPQVVQHAFKPDYDNIVWRRSIEDFEGWKQGMTGYPLVDAGMRELLSTGLMHNRVRMVCASFLTKHLLIDWRWGETWFAQKLLDFDLSANNGNWQWVAGSGCDAAPYFRIFNPESQQQKFDPDEHYIRRWVPEYGTTAYPPPMVEHSFARQRCLDTYKAVLKADAKSIREHAE